MIVLDRKSHETDGLAALGSLRGGEPANMAIWLRQHLFEHIMPFWESQVDQVNGGIFTCVKDNGEKVAGDKWLWSQWRAVWVYARIFNTLDADPKWLRRAQDIATFCVKHGWLESEQGWALQLEDAGDLKRGYESIYVDAFAIYGMVELAQASGDSTWLDRARVTADAAVERIANMGDALPHFPYQIHVGCKPQGVPMIFSLKIAALAAATGESRYADFSRAALDEIENDFYDPVADRVFESVGRAPGTKPPPLVGDVTVPGHVVEGLWFRRLIVDSIGHSPDDVSETWRRMRRHFDFGWDTEQGGGFFLAIDSNGPSQPQAWMYGDMKLWWPHTEALFAAVLGWHETGDKVWMDWYDRLWRFAWQHYVDWENGEWRQKLNRDMSPFTGTVALPVKDPFHLPRSLILQIELLESGKLPPVASHSKSPAN